MARPRMARQVLFVEESPTRMIDRIVEEEGIDRREIIWFSAGQPGSPPPAWALEEFSRKIVELGLGAFRYTPSAGRKRLRELVAQDLEETGGPSLDPGQVVITAGGQEAMFAVFSALLDPGDEVLVLEPQYFGYWGLIRYFQLRPVVVEERLEEGFQPPVEKVNEAVRRGRTKAIIVVSPDNPTGRVVERSGAKALAEIAADNGAWLFVDEAYRTIVYDGASNPVFYDYAPENVVGIGAFSKDPGIPGWRLGYVYAERGVAEKIRLVSEKIVYCPPLAAQLLVEAYLSDRERRKEFIEETREAYRAKRDLLVGILREVLPEARFQKPMGSMFMYIDLSAYLAPLDVSSREFAERLLREERVAVVPGEFFEKKRRVYRVRVNFTAESEERIRLGVERAARLVERLTNTG